MFAMKSGPTGSPSVEFSGRQELAALSDTAHRPPITASTSVTPSPLKSPNCN